MSSEDGGMVVNGMHVQGRWHTCLKVTGVPVWVVYLTGKPAWANMYACLGNYPRLLTNCSS